MTHAERFERRQRMVEKVNNGMDPRQVAAEFGVSYPTVMSARKEFDPGRTFYRSRVSVNCFQILAKLFDLAATYQAIADDMRVSRQRVGQIYDLARKAGVPGLPIRPKGNSRS